MRDVLRRFRRAVRTIPRRVRWMLIAPVAFIVLFVIDGSMAFSVFFAVFVWLVVGKLLRTSRISQGGDWDASASRAPRETDRRAVLPFGEDILPFERDIMDDSLYGDRHFFDGIHGTDEDSRVNPATGWMMAGALDGSGNFYGCDDNLFGDRYD